MKSSKKVVAGLVGLAMGMGVLILSAAPPAQPVPTNPSVNPNSKIAPGVSGTPTPAPGVSTNLPSGVSNKPF